MSILLGTSSGFSFRKSTIAVGQIEYVPVLYDNAITSLLEPEDRLWQTLPSFYRDFLQNKEIIESVWMATRLLISAELLNLYQVSYNSSSQDAMPLFQRKWQKLNFNQEFTTISPYIIIGDSSVEYKTSNISSAYAEYPSQDYAEVSLSNLLNGQRADFVFFGDTYSSQSVKYNTSLKWDLEFSLPSSTSEHNAFLSGYTSTKDTGLISNSLLAGIRSTSSFNKNLYLCFVDPEGSLVEVTDSTYNIDPTKRYKLVAEYSNQSKVLSCSLEQYGSILFPLAVSETGGSFDALGKYSNAIISLSFHGTSIPVVVETPSGTFNGTLYSTGYLYVTDLASQTPTYLTVRKAGEEAIPSSTGTGLYTNEFKFPSGSTYSIRVGDLVKVYNTTAIDTDGDGIADTIPYKKSYVQSINTTTGIITLEAAIISINVVETSANYPLGFIPDLVFVEGYSGLLLDVDGDGIKDTAVSLTLDVVGTAPDYKFEADSFGLVGFNGSSNYPIPSNPVTLYSWQYSWPVLTNDIAYLPSLRVSPTSSIGELFYGTGFNLDENRVLLNTPSLSSYYAEYAVYDEDVLYNNFGYLLGLSKESSNSDYKAKIRALLFSLYKGPTVKSIRSGFGLYLGLPITEVAGTVTLVNDSYSTNKGQIVINDGEDHVYYYSKRAGTSLVLGDTVEQFQLLADGVDLHDYISTPEAIKSIGLSEIEKFHTMLLDFNLTKLDPVKLPEAAQFVERIKPTYKKKIIRGILETLDEENIQESFLISITQSIIDPFCSFPQPRYDNQFYLDRYDYDYAYDQFIQDFLPTGGISSITSYEDGVPSAVIIASRDYNHYQLDQVYGDGNLREFISGVIELTSGSTTAVGVAASSGTSTAFTTEVSPVLSGLSAGQDLFLILQPYIEGTGASATQYSNLLVGSAGDFDDLAVGDIVVLTNLQIDTDYDGIVDTDSPHDNGSFMVVQTFGAGSDSVELTHAFVNRPTISNDTYTNISWYAYKEVATSVQVVSVTDDTNLELNTATPSVYASAGPTKYLATMTNPDFVAVYYDYFEEYCPNEEMVLYFGSDFSISSDGSSITSVYAPNGLSYPPTIDGSVTYPGLSNEVDYTLYNSLYNYASFSIDTDSANPDTLTFNSSLISACREGDWLAFPLLPNSSAREGLTAEDALGSYQSEDSVVFTNETLSNSSISPNPHYLGFSWHRVTSITGSYSATSPQITPPFASAIGTQTGVDSGLLHIQNPTNTSGAGIALGVVTGSSPFILTFQYSGQVAGYYGDYDPDDVNKVDDHHFVSGMFLLAIQQTTDWDATVDQIDIIIQLIGEITPTANPNEYQVDVRIWSGTQHSNILSSFSNSNIYQLCPVDFTHPLQQSTVIAEQNIGSRLGMSEIFDVYSNGGAVHNPTEIVIETSGSKEDGTLQSTIAERTA